MSDNADKASFWVGAIGVPLIMALAAVAMLWNGFIVEHLWNWFAPPFTAVRLTIPEAIGLSCLMTMVRAQPYQKAEDGFGPLLHVFLTPTLALTFGFVAHLYLSGAL